MKLQFIRPHRQWKPGDLGEVTHEGAAKELIRRGLAYEFIETPAEPESTEAEESVEAETTAEREEQRSKKHKRRG